MEFCFGDSIKIQVHSKVCRLHWVTKYVCIGIALAHLELQSTLQTSQSSEVAFNVTLYWEKPGAERQSHLHNEIEIINPNVPFEADNMAINFQVRSKHNQ